MKEAQTRDLNKNALALQSSVLSTDTHRPSYTQANTKFSHCDIYIISTKSPNIFLLGCFVLYAHARLLCVFEYDVSMMVMYRIFYFFPWYSLPAGDFQICLKNIRTKNNKNIRTKSNCIFLVANIAEVLSLVSYLFEKLKALQETPWIRDLNERAII